MAAMAVREAMSQAGLDGDPADLIVGGTTAGMFENDVSALNRRSSSDPSSAPPPANARRRSSSPFPP